MKYLIVALMCLCSFMYGCSEESKKDGENEEQTGTAEPDVPEELRTNIYVVGTFSVHDEGRALEGVIPALWKNGDPTLLSLVGTGSENGRAKDVCILGDDVYAVGHVMVDWESGSDATRPVIWKNGIVEVVDLETEWGEYNSICALNGDIYVVEPSITNLCCGRMEKRQFWRAKGVQKL